jgi:hypothetical protein
MSENTTQAPATPVQPTLDGQAVTQAQLAEAKKSLPGNQRIQEIKPGENRTLTRFRD